MENDILKVFGKKIRELRKAKGWSQEELAERSGFHRTYIGMVERGERNVTLKNIKVFSQSLDITLKNLFDE